MEHHFNPEYARKYGIEEAVFINHFQFWIKKNRACNKNLHDGRTWTYNTIGALAELFPYMSVAKVRHTVKSLVDQGVLITGNYNATQYDRTLWYAFSDENAFIEERKPVVVDEDKSENSQIHLSKLANGSAKNDKPIPYSNTDNKTDDIPLEEKIKKVRNEKKNVAKQINDIKRKVADEKTEDKIWPVCVETWFDANKELIGIEPVFSSREAKALKDICAELKRRAERSGVVWDEFSSRSRLHEFFVAASMDNWLKDNFMLFNIYNKMNSIFKTAKHGTKKPTAETRGKASGAINFAEKVRKFGG